MTKEMIEEKISLAIKPLIGPEFTDTPPVNITIDTITDFILTHFQPKVKEIEDRKTIEDFSWEELSAITYDPGMQKLTVISNAPNIAVKALYNYWINEAPNEPFEETLRKAGYVAVTGQKTELEY